MSVSNLDLVQKVRKFATKVRDLEPSEKSVSVYADVLGRLREEHVRALRVQCDAVREFVEKNLTAITNEKVPLLLNDPILSWRPLDTKQKPVHVDLMPGLVAASAADLKDLRLQLLDIAVDLNPSNVAVIELFKKLSADRVTDDEPEKELADTILAHVTNQDVASASFATTFATVMNIIQSSGNIARVDLKKLTVYFAKRARDMLDRAEDGGEDCSAIKKFLDKLEDPSTSLITILPDFLALVSQLKSEGRLPESVASNLKQLTDVINRNDE